MDNLLLDKLLIATDQVRTLDLDWACVHFFIIYLRVVQLEDVEQLVKLIDRDPRSLVKEALFRCLTRLESRNRRYVGVLREVVPIMRRNEICMID